MKETGGPSADACAELPRKGHDAETGAAVGVSPAPSAAGRLKRLLAAIDCEIAAIDEALSEQVSAILHTPAFQQLEASWRGLLYLTEIAAGIANSKVRLLSASWIELVRDFDRAPDFDRSQLFDKIYSQEFGMPGGEPFGLIVGDYAVQHQQTAEHPTDDVTALKELAEVAAAAFVPIVLGVAPFLLKLDSFRALGRPNDLAPVFRQAEYMRWNAMREGDDMRFIGLAMPRTLMRLPYTDDNARHDGFRFREAETLDGTSCLWGNAAFAFAGVVLRAFGRYGWFADIRGAPRDELRAGVINDLPVPSFRTDRPGAATKLSSECFVTNSQENDLADLGFIALRKVALTGLSVFNECPSLQVPKRYDKPEATANARLSSMLHYMLCVSRFAHYLKVLGRAHIGSVGTAEECQESLQRWLFGYCGDGPTSERYPLREASVEVKDVPGKPGSYACTVWLRPHFQIDDIAAGFRLVTELAPMRP